MMDIVDAFELRAGKPLPGAAPLRRGVHCQSARRGEILFHEGGESTRVYWVRSGLIKLSYTSKDGQERIREFVAEGQVFACLEALEGKQHALFTATVCQSSQLEWIDYAALAQLAQQEALWAQCLTLFVMDTALNRGAREHELLTLLPQERFIQAIAQRPWLLDRVTQRDLAAYIGVTPVSLSRFKSRLKASGEGSSRPDSR